MGAWIETKNTTASSRKIKSLPSWERGLKHTRCLLSWTGLRVAPLVGAWIETDAMEKAINKFYVAPLVGAWIETSVTGMLIAPTPMSLPSWERGLKLIYVKR